jgi:hypothetical protein
VNLKAIIIKKRRHVCKSGVFSFLEEEERYLWRWEWKWKREENGKCGELGKWRDLFDSQK